MLEPVETIKEVVSEVHPSEAQFAKDHPELEVAPAKAAKAEKKAALESALESESSEPESKPTVKKEAPKEQRVAQEIDEFGDLIPVEEQPVESEEEPAKEQSPEENAESEEAARLAQTGDPFGETAVEAYAAENKVTPEKAREELAQLKAIDDKYKGDRVKLAKAYRETQSAFDSQKAQTERAVQAALVNRVIADPKRFVADAEAQVINDPKSNPEGKTNGQRWIGEFRSQFPAKSEAMTDAQILEECRVVALNKVNKSIEEHRTALKTGSVAKREALIKGIGKQDMSYVGEVSKLLKDLPDETIMAESFDFEHALRWARGSRNNMSRVFKLGLEQGKRLGSGAQIIGENNVVAKSGSSGKPVVRREASAGARLTDKQRTEADTKYGSIADPEIRYSTYLENQKYFQSKKK